VRARIPCLVCAAAVLGCSTPSKVTSAGDAGLGEAGVAEGGRVDASMDARASDGAADGAAGCAPFPDGAAPPPVFYYQLDAAAFPDASTPSVAVHIPPGFDPSQRPGLIVFFHGWDNCVTNVLGSVDSPCVDGGAARVAMHLADQIDGAKVNAILVAVELEVDMSTGDPGQLAVPGTFKAMLHELLTDHLDAVLGCPLDVSSLDRIVLSSHSGGYWATASVLSMSDIPQIREVDLLDSLYGELPSFYGWVQANLAHFNHASVEEVRWRDIYTTTGGTDLLSQTMANDVQGWLDDAGLGSQELDDRTTDTLDAGAYIHPVVFKLTDLGHDQVPQFYVQELAKASGFASIP
jgi:hypothetical protein